MTPHQPAALRHAGTLVLASLLAALPAAAQIDVTGRWRVVLDDQAGFDADQELDIVFTQTGSTLASNLGWTGTIDSATGTFHLEQVRECGGVFVPPDPRAVTIDGTVDPGGDSFAGTFSDFIRPTRSCLAIGGPATGTRVESVFCGNDLVDPGEQCDDGPGGGSCCGTDCNFKARGTVCGADAFSCFDYTCTAFGQCLFDATSQPDGDGDFVADRCDPCTSGGAVDPSRLDLIDVERPTGGGRMKVRGTVTPASLAGVDPVADGLRVRVLDIGRTTVFDATAPGGAYDSVTRTGWKVRRGGRDWTYRGAGGAPNSLGRVKVSLPSSRPGTVDLRLRGVPPQGTVVLPLTLTVVLDPPLATTGICGEMAYSVPNGECERSRSGRSVSCRSGAR